MIPRTIWSIWLNDNPIIPDWIQRCLDSQKLEGFEHNLVTLDKIKDLPIRYVWECVEAKKWAKAADYLRIYYLFHHGGIYLDADVEMLKAFDNELLSQKLFCGEEENGFVSNAIIGVIPHHPLLDKYLSTVERNFIGGGDLVFQPGMYLWTEMTKTNPEVRRYPPEYFLPYNHHMNRLLTTENTFCIHHFSKSWVKTGSN